MKAGAMKLGFWYWFWYGYIWFCILLILGVIALMLIEGIKPMLLVRVAWVIPILLWWGLRKLKQEKKEAIEKQHSQNINATTENNAS